MKIFEIILIILVIVTHLSATGILRILLGLTIVAFMAKANKNFFERIVSS
jgi:hypothetical protein